MNEFLMSIVEFLVTILGIVLVVVGLKIAFYVFMFIWNLV